jgi:hypothetical protein
MNQLGKHAVWSAFVNFAKASIDRQFFVCHAHVSFVSLNVLLRYGFELSCWDSLEETRIDKLG